MNWRDRFGIALGTSFGHFGHIYEPYSGTITVPSARQDSTPQSSVELDRYSALYDTERDTILLPKRNGKLIQVPAVDFWDGYDGDFWRYRMRRLREMEEASGRREEVRWRDCTR